MGREVRGEKGSRGEGSGGERRGGLGRGGVDLGREREGLREGCMEG